jgi:hypothetical protein
MDPMFKRDLEPFFPPNASPAGPTDNPGGHVFDPAFPGRPSQNQQTETGFPVTGAGHGRMFAPGGGTDTHPAQV